jgi:membrane peptidoglycan carboxypeptidase
VRLRARIEQDAFARMTPAWQGLGFPFAQLVPSLATAIGSSSDRPEALAELLAIIRNDGVRDPLVSIRAIHLAAGTPYETALERAPARGERVMHPIVARLLREVLHGVVQDGTARRVAGIFTDGARTALAIGGKTGSGDNRAKKVARDGRMVGSRPLSRTATFAFYLGDRHVGVITAIVTGSKAGDYRFTSALPVTMLRLMAPILARHLQLDALPPGSPTIVAEADCASQNVDPSACPTSRAGRQPNRIVRQGLSLGLVRNTLSCPLAPSCAPPDTPLVGELRGDGQWADCGACPTYTQRPWCWQIDHPGRCAPRKRDVAPVTEAILAPEPPRMRLIISSG